MLDTGDVNNCMFSIAARLQDGVRSEGACVGSGQTSTALCIYSMAVSNAPIPTPNLVSDAHFQHSSALCRHGHLRGGIPIKSSMFSVSLLSKTMVHLRKASPSAMATNRPTAHRLK